MPFPRFTRDRSHGLASSLQNSPRVALRLGLAATKDRLAQATGRSAVRVKVAARADELGLMDAPDVIDGVLGLLEASGLTEAEYHNDVPARIALEIPLYAPGRKAGQVQCPILFCVCDTDSVAPPKATLRHAAKAPRGEVIRYPAGTSTSTSESSSTASPPTNSPSGQARADRQLTRPLRRFDTPWADWDSNPDRTDYEIAERRLMGRNSASWMPFREAA